MFLKLDGTFVVQLFNFAIFFAVLNVVFMRPVSRAIVQRREYINSVTNDYDRYQAEAASCRTQAESIRAAARRDAEAHVSRSRSDASNESAALSAQFNEQVAAAVADADRTVAQEVAAARAGDRRLVSELAEMIVSRTIEQAAS